MKFKIFVITMFTLLMFNAFAGIAPVAHITRISGTAFINKEKVKEGTEVIEGQTIKTGGKKDFVEIKYQNGHVIRVTGSIKIEELNPKTSIVKLERGIMYNLVQKLTEGEVFKVNTKRASMGVRGTKFYIQEDKKESYLCVCDGVVETIRGKEKVDVAIDQDLHIVNKKPLKVTASNDMMRKMGNDVFGDMK